MLSRLWALLLSGLLAFGALAVAGSQALSQAVDVVVQVDRSEAVYGDTINVTVHVFDRGDLVEPSSISAVIDKLPFVSPLTLVRQSVGLFWGAFVFESHPTVVRVNATVGTAQDSGGAVVWHKRDRVWVVPSVGTAKPGQTFTIAVETHDGDGPLRDADFVNITAGVYYLHDYGRRFVPTALNSTRTAVGQYSAVYTVPSDIDHDAVVNFWAFVVRGRSGSGGGTQVYIDFPDPLLVWYRPLAVNGSNVSLEIDVASPSGVALSNASVSLHSNAPPGYVVRELQGTTDRLGAVRFDIPLLDLQFGFSGNATFSSQSQPFSVGVGLFSASVPGEPELIQENPGEFFQIGEAAILRYRLAKGGIPIPDQELFAYGYTSSDIVLTNRVRTDRTGRFELRFIVPSNSVKIDIAAAIQGAWTAFQISFSAVNRLPAIVASADGWHLMVSGRFPERPEPWVARLAVSTKGELLSGPWRLTGGFGPSQIVSGFGGEPFAFNVSLPRFLPEGTEVSLSVSTESFRGGYNVYQVTVVAGRPIVPQTDVGVLVILLAFGIVIAIAASGWRWRRHRDQRIPRRPS